MALLDHIPWPLVMLAALTLGLAPFYPEPHIVEKIRMLAQGNLKRPIDIFDLAYHALPGLVLPAKLARHVVGEGRLTGGVRSASDDLRGTACAAPRPLQSTSIPTGGSGSVLRRGGAGRGRLGLVG